MSRVVFYDFDFGDGTVERQNNISQPHLFSKPGSYVVTVTAVAVDGSGNLVRAANHATANVIVSTCLPSMDAKSCAAPDSKGRILILVPGIVLIRAGDCGLDLTLDGTCDARSRATGLATLASQISGVGSRNEIPFSYAGSDTDSYHVSQNHQAVSMSAQYLAQTVKDAESIHGVKQVFIVAHSLGGVVTAYALTADQLSPKTDRLLKRAIVADSPLLGYDLAEFGQWTANLVEQGNPTSPASYFLGINSSDLVYQDLQPGSKALAHFSGEATDSRLFAITNSADQFITPPVARLPGMDGAGRFWQANLGDDDRETFLPNFSGHLAIFPNGRAQAVVKSIVESGRIVPAPGACGSLGNGFVGGLCEEITTRLMDGLNPVDGESDLSEAVASVRACGYSAPTAERANPAVRSATTRDTTGKASNLLADTLLLPVKLATLPFRVFGSSFTQDKSAYDLRSKDSAFRRGVSGAVGSAVDTGKASWDCAVTVVAGKSTTPSTASTTRGGGNSAAKPAASVRAGPKPVPISLVGTWRLDRVAGVQIPGGVVSVVNVRFDADGRFALQVPAANYEFSGSYTLLDASHLRLDATAGDYSGSLDGNYQLSKSTLTLSLGSSQCDGLPFPCELNLSR